MNAHNKLILQNFSNGKLLVAINLIKSENHKYDAKTISRFIVSMCHACQNNSEQVEPEMLADGLKYLVSFVDNFNEQQLDYYTRSLYYFVGFFMDKNKDDLILELEHVILPKFLPAHLGVKERSVYETIAWYLLSKMQKNIEAGSNRCNYTKLCYLLLAIYFKIEDAKYMLSNSSFICIHILSKLIENSESSILQFYCFVLSQLDRLASKEYVELIKCFTKIYSHLLKTQFEGANICFVETMRISRILFKSEEYDHLRNLLKLPEWLAQAGRNVDFCESLEQYKKVHGFNNELQATCRYLVATCTVIAQNNLDLNWYNMPQENHIQFYQFLYSISEMWLRIMIMSSDCCANNCQVRREVVESLKTLNLILLLGKLHTVSNDITADYQKCFLRYYHYYIYYVDYLKKKKCSKWKTYWRNGAGHIHSIINKQSGHEKLEYLKEYVRSVIALEEPSNQVMNKNCLFIALSTISLIYSNQEQFEKALAFISLNIAIHLDQLADIESELMKWVGIKAKCRMNDGADLTLQELTTPSVLQRYQKEIQELHPHFQLDEKLQIKLLLLELNCYKTKWTSKVSMMVAFRDLYQFIKPARAAEIFVDIYGESNKAVHPEMIRLLDDIIGKLNKKPQEEIAQKVHLAYLYFLKNKHESKEIINCYSETICAQLNASKIVPEPGFGLDIGEHQGDLASYEFLNLNRYEKSTENLTKAVDLIFGISESLISLNQEVLETLLRLLINIGLHYILYGHVTKPMSIWTIALKVTDLLWDSDLKKFKYQLQIIGFMMERSNASLKALNKLARCGDDVVQKFEDCSEEVVNYNICKALAFLIYDFDTAYTALCKVLKYKENFKENHLMKARINFVHHKFIMFPCKFNVSGHRNYNVVKMHNAYSNAATQGPNENSVEEFWRLIVYFETCEELTKMYCLMDMPREVKSYGKEALILAQKMMLSLRSLSFLYYLAQADMRSRDLYGLRMKKRGFAEIMGLSRNNKLIRQKQIETPSSELDKIMDDLQCEFDEITLDCPSTHFIQRSASSPSFQVKTFTPPLFCEHPDQCTCSYCTLVEYQAFTLKHYYLEALHNTANELHDVAKDYFMGCVKLFSFFKTKHESKEIECMSTFENVFLSTYYQVLLGFSDCLALTKNFSEARKVNQKLLSYLTTVKSEHVFFYEAALNQAVMIGMKTQIQPKLDTKQFLEVDSQYADCVGAKTPENRMMPRPVPVPKYSASPVPTPKKPWKGIKLEFPEDFEIKEKSPVLKDVLKTADVTPMPSKTKVVQIKPKSLVENMIKNPAPSTKQTHSNLNVDKTPAPPKMRSRTKSPSNPNVEPLPSNDAIQATSPDSEATPAPFRTKSRAKSPLSPNVNPTPSGETTQPTTEPTLAISSRTRSRAKSPSSRNVKPTPSGETDRPTTEPILATSRTRSRAKSSSSPNVKPAPSGETDRPTELTLATSRTRSRAKSPSSPNVKPTPSGETDRPTTEPILATSRTRSRAKSPSSPNVKLTPSGETDRPTTDPTLATSRTRSRAKSPSSLNVAPTPFGETTRPTKEVTLAPSKTRSRTKSPSRLNVAEVTVEKIPVPTTERRTQKLNRKKPILSDLLEPNQDSNENDRASDDIIDDASPFAHTPQTLKVDAKLESVLKSNRRKNTTREDTENNFFTPQTLDFKNKTKLLTEKFKKSSRKCPASVTKQELKQDEEVPVPVPISSKRSAVRTNLLNKLVNEGTPQSEMNRTRRNANKDPSPI